MYCKQQNHEFSSIPLKMKSEVYCSNLHKGQPCWIPMPFRKFPWPTHFSENPFLEEYLYKIKMILIINSTKIIEICYICMLIK